ncbi:MAG TPA: methyltransferase domain-containing protein [Chryseosolibacter sp.]
MIEIRHLRLIEAISRVGSLTKASEELFLSQSALSHQLKELEDTLGMQVFYRINNQLQFTPAGREILETGKDILGNLEKLRARLQQLSRSQLKTYIHGYSDEESRRLNDQATSTSELLHYDSLWPKGSTVLEAACGVGAQTRIISQKNPEVRFTSIDLSEKSLTKAMQNMESLQIKNVEFLHADVFDLPFENNQFDHVFVCFLLEHLAQPEKALKELIRVLKPGGTITVIEGDHGSTYFHPDSIEAQKAFHAQVTLQKKNGGNANIGRQLYPMLASAGFTNVKANPRVVYVDDSKPELVEGFTRNTFTAMIKGIGDEAIANGIISKEEFEKGIKDLYKTAEVGGTFCYTFFKVVAIKPW